MIGTVSLRLNGTASSWARLRSEAAGVARDRVTRLTQRPVTPCS